MASHWVSKAPCGEVGKATKFFLGILSSGGLGLLLPPAFGSNSTQNASWNSAKSALQIDATVVTVLEKGHKSEHSKMHKEAIYG